MKRMIYLFMFLFFSFATYSQETIEVSGKVVDEKGVSMPGVYVLVKGTSTGTLTDLNGEYKIKSLPNAELVFTFVGYEDKSEKVNSRTIIDVKMEIGAEDLSELVVVGYGVQKKADLTGAITALSKDKLNVNGVIVAPQAMLSGKISGLQVSQSSGEPGSGFKVRFRGGTSITAGNDPLYVVDGFPLNNNSENVRNPLNTINPNDIEDVSVLKDASATAIYGARASNGVIIINTKRGKIGTGSGEGEKYFFVNYNANASYSLITKRLEFLNANEFRAWVKYIRPDALSNLGTSNTIWQDEIFKNALSHNHSIDFNSGGKNYSNYFSLGYQYTDGIVKNSSNERATLNYNNNLNLFDDILKIKTSIKGAFVKDVYVDAGGAIGGALRFDPTQSVHDTAKRYNGYFEYFNESPSRTPANPVALLELKKEYATQERIISNLDLTLTLPFYKAISFSFSGGVDYSKSQKNGIDPRSRRGQEANLGSIWSNNAENVSLIYELLLKWNKRYEKIHSNFEVVLGHSFQDFIFTKNELSANNIPDNANLLNIQNSGRSTASILKEETRLAAFFGRMNYSYKDKILLTASIRADGSSKAAPENAWGIFPAFSAGWKMSSEPFFRKLISEDVMNNLKFRLSWGETGNLEIYPFQYLNTFTQGNNLAQVQLGNTFYSTLRPNAVDRSVKWERASQWNAGLDLGFMRDRITLSFNYYNKVTSDLLFNKNVAQPFLATQVVTNIGEMVNEGVELEIGANAISVKNFRWDITFTGSYNKNKILKLDDNSDPNFIGYESGDIDGGFGNKVQIRKVGENVNSFYLYEHNYKDGNPVFADKNGNNDGSLTLEDFYKDQNGDKKIDVNDKKILGITDPISIIGFTNNFRVFDFDLSIVLKAHLGNSIYNNVKSQNFTLNRLTSETVPNNTYKDAGILDYRGDPLYFSSYFLESGDFLRFENITLGYSFNVKKIKSSFRVFFTAQNALLFTKYTGFDPEIDGIDKNIYPKPINLLLGASIKFN